MARALVEVVGDAASAVRALEQTSVAVTASGDAAKKAAVDYDALAASMTKASATRAEGLLAQSAALKQQAATGGLTATEQAANAELAIKKQTQAYKLLGVQAMTTQQKLNTAGNIGRGLTTYVTAPAAFIGYEAVKRALDFNQALLLIRTQAGASEAELQRMNTSVLQLVQSGNSYGQSAQQMAQGLYYVESEGIRGGRALAILQAAAAGAAKGQTDMASTTNALTSAMKIWNVSASGAVTTMATIDAITATGKMHLEDLNAAFQTKFFTTAKQLGIPLEQAGAALDVFTKAGVPAETAANNMTTSFIKMLTPAKAAVPYLQQLGLSTNSLGQALQSGGLSKALSELAAGYNHLVQTQGKFQANRAVLESFGGSRSGAPALALVQQYGSYLQSLQQIQRLNNPATFWSQVSEAMNQPAMKIKQDVAEIGADFIKLGTALAPTVATLAGGISKIASGFQALPGPIKDAVGIAVATLAVAGPLGLAIKGVGTLILGLRGAFGALAGSEAALGASSLTAETGLAAVAAEAAAMLGPIAAAAAAVYGLDKAIKALTGFDALSKVWGTAGWGADQLQGEIRKPGSKNPYPQGTSDYFEYQAGLRGERRGRHPGGFVDPNNPAYKQGVRAREQQQHAAAATHSTRTQSSQAATPTKPAPITQFALPQNLATEHAQALAGYANLRKVDEGIKHYILSLISSGRLHGKALEEAYTELASLNSELASSVKKSAAAAKKAAAASGKFALPEHLQVEMARADAQAALTGQSGPDAAQLRLAREAKAAAMKAINSHKLTMQGLIDAWNQVAQDNSVLAQAKGAVDTYHAVSTQALTAGLGLTRDQRAAERERLAQAEAHRGFAPNVPGRGKDSQGVTYDFSGSHFHGVTDIHKLEAELAKLSRRKHVRTGQRR